MPEWMTPLLWPVWWVPSSASFSQRTRWSEGVRSSSARAVASPTMPPPMMAMSYVMDRSIAVRSPLLQRRERRGPPDLVDHALEQRAVGLRRLAGGLPVGVGLERRPRLRAVREVVERADVDQLVGLADDRLPEADHLDAVLDEQLHGDVGEAPLDVRHLAGRGVVRAVLVDHRAPSWCRVVQDDIPSRATRPPDGRQVLRGAQGR